MIKPILEGCKVLVCRPEPSASQLGGVLTSVGASVKLLPCLDIAPLKLSPKDKDTILNLDRFEHIIVISQHAAKYGIAAIDEYWPQLPTQQNWYAIGRQTARSLPPEAPLFSGLDADMTSEELLECAGFREIKGQNVLVLKGVGGRSTLHKKLQQKGAKVTSIELYERRCPQYSTQQLTKTLADFSPDFFVALSGETLMNLFNLLKQIGFDARHKGFILSSNRVANIAIEHGFNLTYVPKNLMPIDIIQSIAKARRK